MNRIPPQQYNPNMHPQNRGPPPQQGGNQQGNGKTNQSLLTTSKCLNLTYFSFGLYNN